MKSAFDLSHVKSVSAAVLLYNGEYAGKIVSNWSDNPAGSVCTTTFCIWRGPCTEPRRQTFKSGGYGYCKLSQNIESFLIQNDFIEKASWDKYNLFRELGYEVIEAI